MALAGIILALVFPIIASAAVFAPRSAATPTPRETGRVIVEYRLTKTLGAARVDATKAGARVVGRVRTFGLKTTGRYVVVSSDALSTGELMKRYRTDPAVQYVEPDYVIKVDGAATPNDPLFGGLWGFSRIGAPLAWGASTGQADVVVADIDTGVDYTHPDLAANMWRNPGEVAGNGLDDDGNGYVDDIYGIDAAGRSSDPADDHGHGTHTSGTMAAVGDNHIGVTGVNWTARIMALKFMDSSGSGYTSDAIACINYMTAEKLHYGVNVVAANCSWGGGDYSSLLHNAIAAAGDAGIVFACAAGNDGLNNDILPSYPASFDCSNIISVAATDADDALASFSNFGATSVDLAAPGVNILSTVPAFVDAGGYEWWNGTSMATPHVTGAVALMAAAYPAESMATRIGMLESGVDPVAGLVGKVATGGRLDLAAALYRETPLTITGFTPASGSESTSVTVAGTGFTGATAVRFNGSAAATFTVDSAKQITATVPAGATSGPISVTAPAGAAASPTSFTVAAAPPGDLTAPSVDAGGATQGAWYRGAKTITLTATDDEPGGSGVASITYVLDDIETTVPGATALVSVPASPNARHTLTYHATDAATNVCAEQMLTFAIDTLGPTTAGKAVSGRKGRYIRLRYVLRDNLSPKATGVRIVVRNARHKVVKRLSLGTRSTAAWHSVRWKPRARGTFRYYVYGKDLAGKAQSKVGSARIRVR